MFLKDEELHALLATYPDLFKGLDTTVKDYTGSSAVQPASVDLRIGEVYVPGQVADQPGSAANALQSHILDTGATAVVTTLEVCKLPAHIGAFGFPPSSVSSDGLLMTNPGHIDPGYEGVLSFTVINMGAKPYALERGKRIVTLLVFRLTGDAKADYAARTDGASPTLVSEELLGRLSHDFVNVERRAEDVATRSAEHADRKAARNALLLTAAAGGVAVILGLLSPVLTGMGGDVGQLKNDVSALKATQGVPSVNRRIKSLEAETRRLRARLRTR